MAPGVGRCARARAAQPKPPRCVGRTGRAVLPRARSARPAVPAPPPLSARSDPVHGCTHPAKTPQARARPPARPPAHGVTPTAAGGRVVRGCARGQRGRGAAPVRLSWRVAGRRRAARAGDRAAAKHAAAIPRRRVALRRATRASGAAASPCPRRGRLSLRRRGGRAAARVPAARRGARERGAGAVQDSAAVVCAHASVRGGGRWRRGMRMRLPWPLNDSREVDSRQKSSVVPSDDTQQYYILQVR